ncbi:Clp protease [Nocardia sp. ET3-3]|uniref:Clp protease n=1 Tax=Nocardia terrae TaxID=2675851 RepID=A0A7K1VC91_9NOCA|nr:Clp protease N-terminal domain-containing protein [Nocardia terrae]MVU83748.1 Clp protease [Nocardia terrae]
MSIFATKDFDIYFRGVYDRAAHEASEDGSATVEAQHLLLGIAAQHGTEPQRMLAAAGLDYDSIRAALDREFEESLAVAGVALRVADLPRPVPAHRAPNMGATGKLALERMTTTYSKSELRPPHLLLAILRAEVGTVPRALAVAGIDRTDLLATLRAALTE